MCIYRYKYIVTHKLSIWSIIITKSISKTITSQTCSGLILRSEEVSLQRDFEKPSCFALGCGGMMLGQVWLTTGAFVFQKCVPPALLCWAGCDLEKGPAEGWRFLCTVGRNFCRDGLRNRQLTQGQKLGWKCRKVQIGRSFSTFFMW